MKNTGRSLFRASALVITAIMLILSVKVFDEEIMNLFIDIAVLSAKGHLPADAGVTATTESYEEYITEEDEETTEAQAEVSVIKPTEVTSASPKEEKEETSAEELTQTDKDIAALVKSAERTADKDKKDADIYDYKYTNDGVTDVYGNIKIKNTNKTQIDIEAMVKEGADLTVTADEPSVLIYHTHTTETYQLLDRDFYATNNKTRSDKEDRNMVRVGKAICEQLEKAGYKVIHVTDVHDKPYTGAYSRSRETVSRYLEKYPSIQITLDIHRDAIQRSDGTKIAPTVEINGEKAAQIMIISGCQEEGNEITNLPDWKHNLRFALQLQQKLEDGFPGITRPIFFCGRSYNMNLTHNSLLVEVGSDANTLSEAVYTGKCLGVALARLMKEYEK